MKLYELIAALVQYGIDTGLTPACERIYTTNLLLDQFHEEGHEEPDAIPSLPWKRFWKDFSTKPADGNRFRTASLIGIFLTPGLWAARCQRPSQIQETFRGEICRSSPKEATDYFYKLSQDSNYIRRYRVCKDQKWKVPSIYGDIDITINLSKPEKDPKAIAAAGKAKASAYPNSPALYGK